MIQLLSEKKLRNEAQWPKTYTRKFLEQGLVDYADMKLGTLLLRKETIDQMIPSFIDKPVIIKHKEVTPGNFVDLAVGYIKQIYFNSMDGWYYVDYLITHDEGHQCMDDGWGVSCAYKVNQIISGGKYHNIDYKGEIVAGQGEHLALVENPRYEDCLNIVNGQEAVLYNEKTFQNRSQHKPEEKTMLFNLFGKKEEKGFSGDTLVDLGNGKKVKLADVITFNNSLAEKHEIDGKEEITLANGKKITLEEAVNNMKNAATDDKEKEDEEKAKKVQEGEAKTKAENAMKFKNCGCGGKDDKHMDSCKMYNADGSDKEMPKEDKEKNMENEIKALRLKNEALESAVKHGSQFTKLETAKNLQESEILLANGTKSSGTIEAKLAGAQKFFKPKTA